MKYRIQLIGYLCAVLAFAACYDDKGNYDYRDINEISISGFGDRDTTYRVLYLADTLRITPEITGSLDGTEDHYTYIWALSSDVLREQKGVIARSRNLELPITLQPGSYSLLYKVMDETTGLQVSVSGTLVVETSHTKGYLVLGDREDGTVQLDMVAMIDSQQDTTVLRDMLALSGLPEMRNGKFVAHTGNYTAHKLWVMSETGSYYLDGATMTGSESNDIHSIFYTSLDVPSDAKPVQVFPQLAMGSGNGAVSGFCRGYLLDDGSLLWATSIIGGEFYGNPTNRLTSTSEQLLDIHPFIFYSVFRMGCLVVYDRENQRFMQARTNANLLALNDNVTDVFPWNQAATGRTLIHGENTRNTLGGASYGRSYALMKDADGNHFIYAFYAQSTYAAPTKLGFWNVKKEIATDLERATRYLFSSSRSQFYYMVDNKMYCYDYTVGAESCRVVHDFGTEQVTWWTIDYWTESAPFNKILLATYDPATGGTLQKFTESQDQNELKITLEPTSVWGGFPRIKSVAWRNSAK